MRKEYRIRPEGSSTPADAEIARYRDFGRLRMPMSA